MEIDDFVELKRPRWAELERLLERAERDGLKRLALDDARGLSRLYRGASSDLLWVRARGGSADVQGYLNNLVGRAYALTYPGARLSARQMARFGLFGFPALLKAEWRMFAASVLIFFAGGGFGWLGMVFDPNAAPYLVPAEHLKLDPVQRAEQEAESDGATAGTQAAFSSFLFTHNIQVAFLAFALGITAGIGTVYMLFTNGVMLGSLAWVYTSKGLWWWFWAWILPHGIPEITAICIAGAAGLVLGRGLMAPKGLRRRQALKKEAVVAVKLLLGTMALFVFAGLIEGTISQIHPPRLSIAFKVSFALAVGAGVYAYLLSGWLTRRTSVGSRTAPR